jgi:hypothetical protein
MLLFELEKARSRAHPSPLGFFISQISSQHQCRTEPDLEAVVFVPGHDETFLERGVDVEVAIAAQDVAPAGGAWVAPSTSTSPTRRTSASTPAHWATRGSSS